MAFLRNLEYSYEEMNDTLKLANLFYFASFPNPFYHATNIRFKLGSSSFVKLSIYIRCVRR